VRERFSILLYRDEKAEITSNQLLIINASFEK
jgi:hypothetical protein